jgi:hypothetical protein
VIFEATVLPNYLANSYFPTDLLREADIAAVGTRRATGLYQTAKRPPEERSTKTYLLAGDERALNSVADLLRDPRPDRGQRARAQESLRQFDTIQLPTPDEILKAEPDAPPGDRVTWEAVLHPAIDTYGNVNEGERRVVLEKWSAWIAQLGGDVATEYQRVIKGLTFVPVLLATEHGSDAARFNPLRALRPMPQVRPIPVGPLRVVSTTQRAPAAPESQRPRSDIRIAAFDGGLAPGLPQLAPFAQNIDLTPEPPEKGAVAHGTMVTSALLYGPLESGVPINTPYVGVDHFRVVPAPSVGAIPDVDLYWILQCIDDQLARYDYPVVNLSLGPDLSVEDDDEPHAWTARLDELAEERGILFVSAVGNNGERDAYAGLNRLQVPADMVNGIGVGACDCRAPQEPWRRAAYSAVGPGRPGARMQPIGVAFGGVDGHPFLGVAPGGFIGEGKGTSFAAPAAAHGLSSLLAILGRTIATPDVLRTFAIHFAEPSSGVTPEEAGFGRLQEHYETIWNCSAEEVSVLYRDSISRDQAIALPFPLPVEVVAGRTVELQWTLAFLTPTDPTDPVDYARAGIEVAFRPHSRRYSFRRPNAQNAVVLDSQLDYAAVVEELKAGAIPSALPVTGTSERRRNEALRRDEGKWETALSFTRRMRASSLYEPQVTVTYVARESGSLVAAPPLDFAMLVSIRAPHGVLLYDAVRQRYPALAPIPTELPIRVQT